MHRVNTVDRLRRGVEAGFDRLEIDLHHRPGRFLLSHDPPVGPFVVGPTGVEFPTSIWNVVQWRGSFLELSTVLDANPPLLYIDLKGIWTEPALRSLVAELESHGRDGDLVGSTRWIHGLRLESVEPGRRFVFGLSRRTISQIDRCIRQRNVPHGMSLSADLVQTSGPAIVRRLREAGTEIYVWDVRHRGALDELERIGAAGAIVDDLTWARPGPNGEAR